MDRIKKINELYNNGHTIIFQTARGMGRSNDQVRMQIVLFMILQENN